MSISKEEMEGVSRYLSNGGLDRLPFERLYWFYTVMKNLADLCEAEIKRRGASPFPR